MIKTHLWLCFLYTYWKPTIVVVLDVKLQPCFLLNFTSEYLQSKEKDAHQILIEVRSMSDYCVVQI